MRTHLRLLVRADPQVPPRRGKNRGFYNPWLAAGAEINHSPEMQQTLRVELETPDGLCPIICSDDECV